MDDGKRTGVYGRQLDVVCRAKAIKLERECEGEGAPDCALTQASGFMKILLWLEREQHFRQNEGLFVGSLFGIPFWSALGLNFGPFWDPLGRPLGLSWAPLGTFWAILAPLGPSYGHLGATLGPLWAILGVLGELFEPH